MTTTSAAALAAGSALPYVRRIVRAVTALTLLASLLMIIAALLRPVVTRGSSPLTITVLTERRSEYPRSDPESSASGDGLTNLAKAINALIHRED